LLLKKIENIRCSEKLLRLFQASGSVFPIATVTAYYPEEDASYQNRFAAGEPPRGSGNFIVSECVLCLAQVKEK
jgi:hypothetical protein